MSSNTKVVVVMPAYNAEQTLRRTYDEVMAQNCVDQVIVVDDSSQDRTVALARLLNATVLRHEKNMGYGANQKTCYREALAQGADIFYIQRQMGHSSIQITCDIYGHLLNKTNPEAAAKTDDLVFGEKKG